MTTPTTTDTRTGTVKWFDGSRGFGFIAPDDGSADLFAHFREIRSEGYKTLNEQQAVQFESSQGPKGPLALNIRPL